MSGGQDIYTTQRVQYEAQLRKKDKRIAELESDDHEWWLQAKEIERLTARIEELEGALRGKDIKIETLRAALKEDKDE